MDMKTDKRDLIYDYVHQQLAAGRQAYVVCPLIEMNEGEVQRTLAKLVEDIKSFVK